MSNARKCLKLGNDFPYDAGRRFWDKGSTPPPPPKDWAHAAARGVLADLQDRAGIKHKLEEVDHATRSQIVKSLAEIIRLAQRP